MELDIQRTLEINSKKSKKTSLKIEKTSKEKNLKIKNITEKNKDNVASDNGDISLPAIQNVENIPKNNGNILSYFSKVTPDQHYEKQKLLQSKVTVRAEVHSPVNLPASDLTSAEDVKKNVEKNNTSVKKKKFKIARQQNLDEIVLIGSETLYLKSPDTSYKLKSPLHNKPKWSMKIKFQAETEDSDEAIYTKPKKVDGEIECDKIPKILLPLKNKKDSTNLNKSIDKSKQGDNEENNKEGIDEKPNSKRKRDNSVSKKTFHKNKYENDEKIVEKSKERRSGKDKVSTNFKTGGDNFVSDKIFDEKKTKDSECKTEENNEIKPKKEKITNKSKESQKKNANTQRLIKDNAKKQTDLKSENDTKKDYPTINSRTAEKRKNIDDDDCEVIEEKILKRKSTEKLAPLFIKKPKLSPELLESRRKFLEPDISDTNNNSGARKQNQILNEQPYLPFPSVSHVQQFPAKIEAENLEHHFSFKPNINNFLYLINTSDFKSLRKNEELAKVYHLKNVFKPEKLEVEDILKDLEASCSGSEGLWNYISLASKCNSAKKSTKSKRRSSLKNKKGAESQKLETFVNQWTDKYKPNCAADIVGNEEAASKVKSWLSSWKAKKINDNCNSSDEFYSSDNSYSSNCDNNQVAVLIGPHGSGKTATVYAVAQELGYKVLEVNASTKRPGKKIFKDFEEATKSHRVKKTDAFKSFVKKNEEENAKAIPQNSLILMEDVDIIFEEDEGFVSACFQLASSSKRPIVLTLRDSCFYLNKLAPEQLKINFQPVNNHRASGLLQLIALAETGHTFSKSCIEAALETGDLRQALLQLQYLLLSNTDNISLSLLCLKNTLEDIGSRIYKSSVKAQKIEKKKQKDKINDSYVLDNVANALDNISYLSMFNSSIDPKQESIDSSEPNLSLEEDLSSYCNLKKVGNDIQEYIYKELSKSHQLIDLKKNRSCENTHKSYLLAMKQKCDIVNLALSQIPSNTLDKNSLYLDYFSNIRTICRSEQDRCLKNSKRGNRFFHYFQGMGLSRVVTNSGSILSNACKIFRDELPK